MRGCYHQLLKGKLRIPGILLLSAVLLVSTQCKSEGPGTLKWKYKTGGSIVSSPAIGHDGTVYIGSSDSCLYAFDPDGNLKWKYQADSSIVSSPVIADDGTIYFSSWRSYTYAITPDGELKWKYQTYSISSPAIGYNGTLYITTYDDYFFAITPEGELKWKSLQLEGLTRFPPAIGTDGSLYLSAFTNVYALDSLGNLKWSFGVPKFVTISAFAFDLDGNVCFGSDIREFYVLTSQGELKARVNFGTNILLLDMMSWTTSLAIGADGSTYLGGDDFIALYSNYTGKWRISEKIGYGSVESTPSIGSDGTIYIIVNAREHKRNKSKNVSYLYAFRPEGEIKWKFKIRSSDDLKFLNTSSPAIGNDATIYVGSVDSCIYAIRSDSKGLADSPWPKYQHDNCNTGRAK